MSARVADVMTTNAVVVRANPSFKEIAARRATPSRLACVTTAMAIARDTYRRSATGG